MRGQVQTNFEDYINDRQYDTRWRFGEILLTLPVLQSISWKMIEHIWQAEMLGVVHIDNILEEVLKGGKINNVPQAAIHTGNRLGTY